MLKNEGTNIDTDYYCGISRNAEKKLCCGRLNYISHTFDLSAPFRSSGSVFITFYENVVMDTMLAPGRRKISCELY